MCSKRYFQIFFIAAAAFIVFLSDSSFSSIERNGNYPSGTVRLRILELRDGGLPSGAQILEAGVLLDGCRRLNPARSTANTMSLGIDGNITLGATPANGYFLVISCGDQAADPVRWVVEVTSDNGSSWLSVGASVWRPSDDGSQILFPWLRFNTLTSMSNCSQVSPQTGASILADARPSISWMLGSLGDKLGYAFFFFSFFLAGVLGHAGWMKGLWIGVLSSDLCFTIADIITITLVEQWFWRDAVIALLNAAGLIPLIIGSAFYEKYLISMLLAFGVYMIIVNVLPASIIFQDDWLQVLQGQLLSLNTITVVFCVGALVSRHRALLRARSLILIDLKRYEAVWNEVCAAPGAETSLYRVNEEVKMLLLGDHQQQGTRVKGFAVQVAPEISWVYQQHQITKSAHSTPNLDAGSRRGSAVQETLQEVSSLDQLFVQAKLLDPILRSKVLDWALVSKGCFPSNSHSQGNGNTYVCCTEGPMENTPIRWARLKSVERAVEKLVRAYGQVMTLILILNVSSISILFSRAPI